MCILKIALFIICFLLLSSYSYSQRAEYGDLYNSTTRHNLEKTGDYIQILLPVVAGGSTLILKDKKGAIQFLKSFGTMMIATHSLKYLIDKNRPYPATDGRAFPSGHTAASFLGASFIQRRYGWKYGIPAYILSSFVGYSRTWDVANRHDKWDVLAGALIGIGSTYLFTSKYQKEHLELTFNTEHNNYQIGVRFKF